MRRLRFVRGVLCLSIWSLAAATMAESHGNNGSSLTGTVFTEGGDRRIANARVALCEEQGTCVAEISADEAGSFSFSPVRPARYVLRARAEGFVPAEVPVDLSFGSQHGLSITLKGVPARGSLVPERPKISAHELSIPRAARELMTTGMNRLYQDKNAQAALTDFQSAAAKAPNYYEAYYQAGMAYLMLQNETNAETQFRKAVDLSDGKYGDADIALGTLLLRRQQEHAGETLLRQGVALNPESWPGQVEIGKLEFARGHLEPALAAAEKAEMLAPLQPMVYRLLAVIHLKQKDYAALTLDLDNYIRLDPDSPAGVRAKELRAEVEPQMPRAATAATPEKK
jgi:Flp pilus assembly protein TadD